MAGMVPAREALRRDLRARAKGESPVVQAIQLASKTA
jgi:hypothetical protein